MDGAFERLARQSSTQQQAQRAILRFVRTKPLGAIAAVLILIMMLSALFAPWITRYSPIEQVQGVVAVDAEILMSRPGQPDQVLHTLKQGDNQLMIELDYRRKNPGVRITTVENSVLLRILTSEETQSPASIVAPYRQQFPGAWEVTTQRLRLLPPSSNFWMGTDDLGRDVWSRVVYGARTSILVGVTATTLAAVLGMIFGVLSAYVKGWFDLVFQRVVDALMTFPLLILALVLASIVGAGLWNVTLLLGLVLSPRMIRVVRASALAIAENQYIEAARAIGASDLRIMFGHIMPNVWAPALVLAGLAMGVAVLTEASLSFLGVGVPPPAPSWGGMISGSGRTYFQTAWWMPVFPGIAISLTILAWNLLGDALRDVLDPRLRGS